MDIDQAGAALERAHSNSTVTQATLVDVAVSRVLPGSRQGVFTYEVPAGMEAGIERGLLVLVPMQKRHIIGIVLGPVDVVPDFETRPLHSIPEPRMVMPAERLAAAEWMARETASSVYSAASLFLPPGLDSRLIDTYRIAEGQGTDLRDVTAAQRRVLGFLESEGPSTLDRLRSATGQSLITVMAKLVGLGLVEHEIRVDQHMPGPRFTRLVRLLDDDASLTRRAPKQAAILEHLVALERLRPSDASDLVPLSRLRSDVDSDAATLQAMEAKGLIEIVELPISSLPEASAAPAPTLTRQQARAWSTVETALEGGDPRPQLLFGVTGSGKTEIYLRGVAWCLRNGRSAIVLVPEIGLATQVVRRFIDRFPGQVAVLHSRFTESQRYDTWQRIVSGEYRVVVGPRSALFAPVANLGLIVLDEEHESSYKQDSEPRYHARAVAQYLAEVSEAALVLGSATPSVESMWHAKREDYGLIELRERVNPLAGREDASSLELPNVEIVDRTLELQQGNASLLSRELRQVIEGTLEQGEQAIVLLNRRGTSTIVMCRACGHRVSCPMCDIPLVFHQDRHQMVCHRCDYRIPPPNSCPDCGGTLDYFGAGTQRVESEVQQAFPGARILRWDQDAVRKQGGYEKMLARVEDHEVDIVVGTQMVAKGFDLPKVTAIGVVQADSMLHLPDFRSGERTFQLLTQVAGRAGRRRAGSRVVVQTYTPHHYAVQSASRHDYDAFYEEEIDFRERHFFPPFVRLARYLYRHEREQSAAIESEVMARMIARHARSVGASLDLLGPTPAFQAKVRGSFQWQIVLRSRDLEMLLDDLPIRPGWVVDIDPQSML
jgi:primosomal protein N' (replication factor Y)